MIGGVMLGRRPPRRGRPAHEPRGDDPLGVCRDADQQLPGVRVKPIQSLVLSSEAQRILTAGGGTSWQDLAIYLIARYVGLREATEVARVYMLQWHDLGQQPFAALTGLRKRTT